MSLKASLKRAAKAEAFLPPQRGGASSIPEFCKRHGISESYYFVLKRKRRHPKEMHVGRRVLISDESAAEWRKAQEEAETSEATAI